MLQNISERIAILRIVMIAGVILLHVPPYVPLAETGPSYFDFIKAYFQSAVFRCSVPVLTVISGYLLFSAKLDRSPAKLWHKKFTTLAIPFLLFNTLLAAIVYLVQSRVAAPITYQLVPFDTQVMMDAAFAMTKAPLNYPLSFIRDLFVLALLAPLFGLMLRHAAFLGLCAVVLIVGFDLEGSLLLRWDMALLFYVGGMAAIQKWDLCALDKHSAVYFLLFVILCALVVGLKAENTIFLRVTAPFLIWPAASRLTGTRLGSLLSRLSKYSYFLFLAHAPVLAATWVVYKKFAGLIPYPVYWICAPVVSIVSLVLLYRLCMMLMPRWFSWMTGQKVDVKRDGREVSVSSSAR
jgi:succinoglycan biosynthesis protein ExoH